MSKIITGLTSVPKQGNGKVMTCSPPWIFKGKKLAEDDLFLDLPMALMQTTSHNVTPVLVSVAVGYHCSSLAMHLARKMQWIGKSLSSVEQLVRFFVHELLWQFLTTLTALCLIKPGWTSLAFHPPHISVRAHSKCKTRASLCLLCAWRVRISVEWSLKQGDAPRCTCTHWNTCRGFLLRIYVYM